MLKKTFQAPPPTMSLKLYKNTWYHNAQVNTELHTNLINNLRNFMIHCTIITLCILFSASFTHAQEDKRTLSRPSQHPSLIGCSPITLPDDSNEKAVAGYIDSGNALQLQELLDFDIRLAQKTLILSKGYNAAMLLAMSACTHAISPSDFKKIFTFTCTTQKQPVDAEGETLLHHAARADLREALIIGIAHRKEQFDINQQNKKGETALHVYCSLFHKITTRIRMSHEESKKGPQLCFFSASKQFNPDIVTLLLHDGTDVNLKNHSGHTVLDIMFTSRTNKNLTNNAKEYCDAMAQWAEKSFPPYVPSAYDQDDDNEPSHTELKNPTETALSAALVQPKKPHCVLS